MKTPQELKEIAEANGWEATVQSSQGLMHHWPGDVGTPILGENFRAVRDGEEATISTFGFIYASIWPRKGGLQQAARSYPGNREYDYPEASEWMAIQLRKGTPLHIRFRNWLAKLFKD